MHALFRLMMNHFFTDRAENRISLRHRPVLRERNWAICIWAICCAPLWAQDATTTSSPASVGQPVSPFEVPLELRFATVPDSEAEIAAAFDEIKGELAALAPTTQPATSQPTTQPDADVEAQLDGWRLELWNRLQEFSSQLNELTTQVKAIEILSQDAEVARLTDTLSELKRKAEDVRKLSIPDELTDDDLAKSKSEYDQNNQAIDALNATLTQQEALLREGFATQRSRITDDLKAVSARREKLDSSFEVDIKAAETDQARHIAELRRRAVAVRAATLEVSRAVLDSKEKRTQQEFEQNKLKRDAMRPYVVALRERMNAMLEAKSRTSAERLRVKIEDPNLSPIQKTYYQLQLLRDETIAKLQKEFANDIADRFPKTELTTRESMVNRDKRWWEEFRDSLSRRSSAEVLNAFRDARNELDQAQRDLAKLQSLLDRSFAEDRQIELLRTRVADQCRELEATFRNLAGDLTDEVTIKRTQQIALIPNDIRRESDRILELEKDVIERIRSAVVVAQDNVALWQEATSILYWAHLITRGPAIVDPENLKAASLEAEDVAQNKLAEALRDVRQSLSQRLLVITAVDWSVMGLSLLVAAYLGFFLVRKCRRISREGLEDSASTDESAEEASTNLTFARRLRYHLARVGVGVVPALLVASVIFIVTAVIDLPGPPSAFLRSVAALICGVPIGFGIFNASFKASKPRYRLIPCSAAVARYYRRNGYAMVILAILLLGPAIILSSLDLAPLLIEFLKAGFVFVATALALVFLIRRETVLNVFPRGDRGRLAGTVTFLRAAHPFSILLVLALLAMHLIGFKALAIYISIGLSSTIGLIFLATVANSLTKEFCRWSVDRVRTIRKQYHVSDDDQQPATATDPAAQGSTDVNAAKQGEDLDAKLPALARASIATIRWLLVGLVLVTSLSIWGIRPYELKRILDMELWSHGSQSVTLWRIGGATLAILLAIVVSRTMRQTLDSRFYPRHAAIDRGAQAAINTLLHYFVLVIGVYVSLQTLRIDFGALAVLFGGLGLGIGLGLQPLIVNFVSGLFILFERHVKVGDVVIVHDKLGEITKVSMRSTTIRTPDGIYMIVPNGEFINQKVENWTLENKPIRGIVEIGVGYGSDARRVKDLLLEIAFAESKVLMEPAPDVFFTQFGDNSLNFSLACWFPNPAERWAGMLSLRYTITEKFRERGIEIPFPQRTLSLINDKPLRVSVSTDGSNPGMPNMQSDPTA